MPKPKTKSNGHGGARPGAGRPTDPLLLPGVRPNTWVINKWATPWERERIAALAHRIPKGTSPDLVELANLAFSRIVDVMNEQVHPKHARGVLAAAAMTREEICGPLRKDINIHHTLSYEELVNKSLEQLPPPTEAAEAQVEPTFTSQEIEQSMKEEPVD